MDGSSDCHSELSKLERDKDIIFQQIDVKPKKKWHSCSYLQSRNRDTCIENKRMDTKRERGLAG